FSAHVQRLLRLCGGLHPEVPRARSLRGSHRPPSELDGRHRLYEQACGRDRQRRDCPPELAKSAAHVTMLQRSPTYVAPWPDEDAIANALRRYLPAQAACAIARWKNVLAGMYFYWLCKNRPERAKAMVLDAVRAELGPDYDVAKHFTPRYNPWDQRLCLAPNGDLFKSIKQGATTVVTDEIETFTEAGIKLRSGRELEADLVVTATGLNLQVMGGAEIEVDGESVTPGRTLSYRAAMSSDVPNLAAI